MKVTFELPPPVVRRLRSRVASGERSKFVAHLISGKLQHQGNALERAAQKANTLHKVNRDMKDWENLAPIQRSWRQMQTARGILSCTRAALP